MDDNGTYLGNIYGIYKECITNISIDIYDIKQSDTQTPNGAAAPLGAPPKATPLCSLFLLFILLYIMNIYEYSLYIPYIYKYIS